MNYALWCQYAVKLLTAELEKLILAAIENNTYPRGWDGSEPVANDFRVSRTDFINPTTVQPHLF